VKPKILIFIFCAGLVFIKCKKYPDDRGIFFTTLLSRLTKHPWRVVQVLFNGSNINSLLNDSLNLGELEDLQLKFVYRDGRDAGLQSYVEYSYKGNALYFSTDGGWNLDNKNKDILLNKLEDWVHTLDPNAALDHNILNNLFYHYWSILNLNKSELKIKNNKGYEITFIAV